MTEPRRPSDFLRQIVRDVSASKARGPYARALDEVLAAPQRSHCQVMGFRNGLLTVEVDSAPLFAELSGFRKEELRLRMNEALQRAKVARLQFRLGGT